ncbi:MAG: gamma-glutamylcyclotransferase [Rhodospirillales bacterium]|nr:gamma-glutamylcyclotransferase [Rhodospirillales bacterium]
MGKESLSETPLGRIAFYGSLRRGFGLHSRLGLEGRLRFVAECRLPGRLVDLGDYPGLVGGIGSVKAELFDILDPLVLIDLDRYEDCIPGDDDASLFVRRMLNVGDPPLPAWVYSFNGDTQGCRFVTDGDWAARLRP